MDTTAVTHSCVVADDEPGVRALITRVLTRANIQVYAASNGHEATALLAAHPCDVLVTDLSMPGGEGVETIQDARRLFPAIKILAISGAFGTDTLQTAQALGADASLAKPFTAEMLVAAVRALLEPADG